MEKKETEFETERREKKRKSATIDQLTILEVSLFHVALYYNIYDQKQKEKDGN